MKIKQIIKEFDDPQGQYTTTTAPADPVPNQGFAVRLTGIPRDPKNGARIVWAALAAVLPRDFPTGDGDDGHSLTAQKLVGRLVTTRRPQVIKAGLTKDVAETVADKIANWPTTVKIPTDIVEQ
jgi:hypothetical protein